MLAKDSQDWVARARALAPMIEAAAGRTEKERKIPADVLSAMHACGLFHMLLPVSLGGAAVDLVTFNQVVEAVAAADASPAWCLAQAVASSHAAGFLDPKIAREVFGAPDALVAWGPPAGVAKAIIVEGGYRVTGKWRFASGSALRASLGPEKPNNKGLCPSPGFPIPGSGKPWGAILGGLERLSRGGGYPKPAYPILAPSRGLPALGEAIGSPYVRKSGGGLTRMTP